jgi:hypothetical protein
LHGIVELPWKAKAEWAIVPLKPKELTHDGPDAVTPALCVGSTKPE